MRDRKCRSWKRKAGANAIGKPSGRLQEVGVNLNAVASPTPTLVHPLNGTNSRFFLSKYRTRFSDRTTKRVIKMNRFHYQCQLILLPTSPDLGQQQKRCCYWAFLQYSRAKYVRITAHGCVMFCIEQILRLEQILFAVASPRFMAFPRSRKKHAARSSRTPIDANTLLHQPPRDLRKMLF